MNEIYLAIENGFSDYIAKKKNALKDIVENFSKLFGKTVHLTIASTWHGVCMNILQIHPTEDTMKKVADVLVDEEFALEKVSEIWTSTNEWRLTLDGGLFDFLNASEIATLAIHEIFMMTCTNKIPKEITEVIQLKLAEAGIVHKKMLKDSLFHKIIYLPIIAACDYKYDKNAVREEIRLDPFISCQNYFSTLLGMFEKLDSAIQKYEQNTTSKNLSTAMEFVESTLDKLSSARISDVKREIRDMKESATNHHFTFLEEGNEKIVTLGTILDTIYNDWFSESTKDEFTFRVSKIKEPDENLFLEFGILAKRLEPITQNQLDYAEIKIEGMESINDKMMIISYLNGKLELVHWYINILDDAKKQKRYRVPHTKIQLMDLEQQIETLKDLAMRKKLPSGTPELVAYYPKGYDG